MLNSIFLVTGKAIPACRNVLFISKDSLLEQLKEEIIAATW